LVCYFVYHPRQFKVLEVLKNGKIICWHWKCQTPEIWWNTSRCA